MHMVIYLFSLLGEEAAEDEAGADHGFGEDNLLEVFATAKKVLLGSDHSAREIGLCSESASLGIE